MAEAETTPTKKKFGITFWLIIIGTCVLGTLALIPNFVKARSTACSNTCVANLKQIDGAKEQWALDTNAQTNAISSWPDLIGPDKYIQVTPTCPGEGKYTINSMGKAPVCSRGKSIKPAHILPE